jgi:hypothetical protein
MLLLPGCATSDSLRHPDGRAAIAPAELSGTLTAYRAQGGFRGSATRTPADEDRAVLVAAAYAPTLRWQPQDEPASQPADRTSETASDKPEAKPTEGAPGKADLATAAQNPIASTIRLPLESTFHFGAGPKYEAAYVLNIQPVLPVKLNDDWNVVFRPIIPVGYIPGEVRGIAGITGLPPGQADDAFGLGDINLTPFFSPSAGGEFVWGAGPSISFPTASDPQLGSGKWSAGPSAVGMWIKKPWLVGALVQHLWSFAGDGDRRNVNNTLFQPFVNYNLDDGWYLVSSPIITINWAAEGGDRWTVPVGGGFGKIFKIGKQPMFFNTQAFYNVARPTNAPEWQLQFTIAFLFPKG